MEGCEAFLSLELGFSDNPRKLLGLLCILVSLKLEGIPDCILNFT